MRTTGRWIVTALITVGFALPASAAPTGPAAPKKPKKATPAQLLAIAQAVSPSLVRVEYTLQHDEKGESPSGRSSGYYGGDSMIRQERPMEMVGYLLSPTQVFTGDTLVAPRFIKKIDVRFGDSLVPARITGYSVRQRGVVLTLARPLKGAKPLTFAEKTVPEPFYGVRYTDSDGAWTVSVWKAAVAEAVTVNEYGERHGEGPPDLTVDGQGRAIAVWLEGNTPLDDSWRGSPLAREQMSAEAMKQWTDTVGKVADRALLRTVLHFRSPRKDADGYSRYGMGDGEDKTEVNCVGLLIGAKRVLILHGMGPKVTARLRSVQVHPAGGEAVTGTFTHTLKDYGALVVELAKPLPGAVKLSDKPIRGFMDRLVMTVDLSIKGEVIVTHLLRSRLQGLRRGWKRRVYPSTDGNDEVFVFDDSGRLIAFPISRREKLSVRERWSSDSAQLTTVAYLRDVLAKPGDHADPSNVPLTEAEERRIAWLGVEMQGLNEELARINKVSDLTQNGEIGGIVSFVYPGSPAAKAGIEPGMILLRLHVQDHPQPMGIEVEESRFRGGFPWNRLDSLSERMFDRVPCPWPTAENALTRTLTDLGFGTKFRLEVFKDGKTFFKDMTVTQSPAHYDMAPRYKCKALGVTARDISYEVRRYFRREGEAPGVILSKIERGSRASVAGLKPYEIVTHVNDKPVNSVRDFEKLTAGKSMLRLMVLRMTENRVVKIETDGAPATQAKGQG